MIARYKTCRSNDQLSRGAAGKPGHVLSLTPEVSYLVLGITCVSGDDGRRCETLYQVLNDSDTISHVPARFFEIEHAACSAYWIARYDEDGSLLLWPKEFFSDFFHDDLTEGDGAAREVFFDVVAKLKKEAGLTC